VRVPTAFLALVAVAAAAPASAHAATVYIQSGPDPTKAYYDAAPGEQNRLTVTYDAPSRGEVTVHDPAAFVQAVAPCEALDEHTARCPPDPVPEGFPGFARVALEARLGDGDDRLITDSGPDYPFSPIVAHGGKGDDVLAGAEGYDWLDGGSGADRLSGGDGSDFLTDGDRSGQSPERDVLDGGANDPFYQEDTVSYEHRTAGVRADLVHGVGGEPGEGDTLAGFESAAGGAGDDRLTDGSPGASHLTGNGGDDKLTGGPGFNTITGGDGDDILVSGPDENVLDGGGGLETYRCSSGLEQIVRASAGELLGALCDELDFSTGEFGSFRFQAQPARTTRRAVWFAIGCPSHEEEDFEPCAAVLKLRGGPGNRLLGRGAFAMRKPTGRPPQPRRVRLTRVGRRLAARPRGVVVTVSFRDSNAEDAVDWTIRLHTGD
jgi:Ca2+-binding RTX toxin-like protein